MTSQKCGKGKARPPGMYRNSTDERDRKSVHRMSVIADDLGWMFRELPPPDYGIDAQVEVVADDNRIYGMLGLQIKGGDSKFAREKGDSGWTFYDSSDHLDYWLRYRLPVLVVIIDSKGNAFWEEVTPRNVHETRKGFSMLIPRAQPFDIATKERLLTIAQRGERLAGTFPDLLAVLPPGAVNPLKRAAEADVLTAARLADLLATGREASDMTAATVIGAPPSWLTASPVAQDLWLAVAGYAAEHGWLSASSKAFALAAYCLGTRAAKARASAGIQVMYTDRDKAREHLVRAREEGEHVMADVGLAGMEIPPDDTRPVDVPVSLRNAPPGEVDSDPFLLNFLAEIALRHRDFTEAVKLREKAVTAAGEGDSTYRLELARTLRRRMLSEPGGAGADLRQALSCAQAAAEERRRWSGPSAVALAEVLDILIAAGDMPAVVTAARPVSEAGTVPDSEAADPGVARRAALAALASGDHAAYEFFLQWVDDPHRRELQVLDSEDQGRSREEMIAAWSGLLDEPANEEMMVRVLGKLTHLGVWPAQADDLRRRSVLPEVEYEVLEAVYRAQSGDPDTGIGRLRELADTSLYAAGELLRLLEQHAGPDAAISEAEKQITRWDAPPLRIHYVDLLGKHGRFTDAAAFIERAIADTSLPPDVRQKLCAWYVGQQSQQGKFADAAATARAGLAIRDDADLAWRLIMVLVNDGKLDDARKALARYNPPPGVETEMRVWMQLHLGVEVIPKDARVMIDLVRRLPDGEFRDAIIAMLIREAAIAGQTGAFPDDVTTDITRLEAETADRPGTGLRIDPYDDYALRATLEKRQPDLRAYQALLTDVQRGAASMADVARLAGRPYGTVLIHRPAGVFPAADLAVGLRAAGERAAGDAIAAGSCVADLSSLHLLGLLDRDDRLRIRAKLPSLIVTRAAVDDALLTRDNLRGVAAATYTASLTPDGTIERTTLTAIQKALLREESEALERLASAADVRYPGTPGDAAASARSLAAENGLALWCDDTCGLQKARGAKVDAFSLLDLLTTLRGDGVPFDLAAIYQRLAGHYVMDLPLTAEDITTLAATQDWLLGPAHTTLARPGWWSHYGTGWEDPWLRIATQARAHSTEALTTITKAALTGALQHVTTGLSTQRYQRIAVLALAGCHDAGLPPPDGLLGHLAEQAHPRVVPRPPYVLLALIQELQQRHVPDAEDVARRLLPGVERP